MSVEPEELAGEENLDDENVHFMAQSIGVIVLDIKINLT